jgi:DNA topoisomerase-1
MPPKKTARVATSRKPLAAREHAEDEFLVIVESPSKITKIESYLGPGYRVIASMGHITCIEGLKSIDTKNQYMTQFSILLSKRGHVQEMRDVMATYKKDHIILATDNDREGEAIGFHLCETFKLPVETTRRIIFNEITQNAIQYAIAHPTVLNLNLIRSQNARQILDIFIGFKISPLLWKYVFSSKSNALSAGRCQTPALRLIYDNFMEGRRKDMGKGGGLTVHYKTVGHFFPPFGLACELNHAFTLPADVRTFFEKSRGFNYTFTLNEKTTSLRAAPTPLNTARLLQTATHLLHASPQDVMKMAQKLYQEGHITYMRTESKKYSQDFLNKAEKYILSLRYGGADDEHHRKYLGDFTRISNEGTGLPHEAIRVTNVYLTRLDTSDQRVNALYAFIWRTTLESCMSSAEYDVYKLRIQAPMDYYYTHSLEIPHFLGWKRLMWNETSAESQNQSQAVLLGLRSMKNVTYTYLDASVTVQGLHSHYTESALIHKLEELGIGRPSTYSTFVDTIQERGYVVKKDVPGKKHKYTQFILRATDTMIQETTVEKEFGHEHNKLVIQPLGVLCIEFLMKHFGSLFEYEYTSRMEEALDKICAGNDGNDDAEPWYSVCEKTRLDIKDMVKMATNIYKQQYPIGDEHEVVFQAFGPCVRHRSALEGGGTETETEYLPIKPSVNLSLDALKEGKYRLDDLILYPRSHLGTYQDQDVKLCTGPYGVYIAWGETKKTIGTLEESEAFFSRRQGAGVGFDLDAAVAILENRPSHPDGGPAEGDGGEGMGGGSDAKILRVLSDDLSVRTGKYGVYVFYKTSEMSRPKFIHLRGFKEDPGTCDADTLMSWCADQIDGKGARGGPGARRGRGGRWSKK